MRFALLLFLPLLFAALPVPVANYLYPEEELSDLKFYNFTSATANYTLVYLNDIPILLYNGSSLVENESLAEKILFEHAKEKYFPSEATINEIWHLYTIFNYTRNNGDLYVDMEEYACRETLGEDLPLPDNWHVYGPTVYDFYATYLCQSKLGQALGCLDPADFKPVIQSYIENSHGIDDDLVEIKNLLDSLNPENISAQLDAIEELTADILDRVSILEKSKARCPREGEECDDCWCICGPLIVNKTALDRALEIIDEIKENGSMLVEFDEFISKLKKEMRARINYLENKEIIDKYKPKFNALNRTYNEIKPDVESVLFHIKNATFEAEWEKIGVLINETQQLIEENNGTSVPENVKKIEELLNETKEAYSYHLKLYQEFMRNYSAVYMLLQIKRHNLDIQALDEEFTAISAEVTNLSVLNIKNLSARLFSLRTKLSGTSYVSMALGFVARGVYPFYKVLDALDIADDTILPFYLTIVTALSFASSIAWLLMVLKAMVFGRKRGIVFPIFAISLISLVFVTTLFSFYIIYSNFLLNGLPEVVMKKLATAEHITLVLDISQHQDLVEKCGSSIISAFADKNIAVVKFANGECVSELCKVDSPYILIKYGTQDEIKFSPVKASIEASLSKPTLEICPISTIPEVMGWTGSG